MNTLNVGPRFKKAEEYRRIFDTLPNVLIQDPARNCAYNIQSSDLEKHEVTVETWSKVNDGTVTFLIPNGELIDEVPASLRNPELQPSVLIRFGQGRSAFFLTFEELQAYKQPQLEVAASEDQISFIIPRGTELIEELPALRKALLQSNTQ